MLVYSPKKSTIDGRTEIYLAPLELLDRLSHLITPPRVHKHRYCGVQAPNAKLGRAVIERVLTHVGAPTVPPQVAMDFAQGGAGPNKWPDMDQTVGVIDDTWE